MSVLPRYPIYVPSAGRFETCFTAKFLIKDAVPFHLVVQPKEFDEYASRFGKERIITLPWDNDAKTRDGLLRARNWIRDHAEATGAARHWQLDDNIREVYRRWKARKIPCTSGVAFRAVEDFSDRYENVGISGMNYYMFSRNKLKEPPFIRNAHIYSCTLVNHAMPFRWRLAYNDDTDLCLQALAGGWCTIQFLAFLVLKMRTMTVKGGNTGQLYQGDGRLRMAKALERVWPGVVTTRRRFQRPQHVIKNAWRSFDVPLRRKAGVDFEALAGTGNEYGMELRQVKDEIKSDVIRKFVEEYSGKK